MTASSPVDGRASLTSALLYLKLTSARNWTSSRLRRLRQPKYAFGALVGAAYLWFFLIRPMTMAPGVRRSLPPELSGELEALPMMFILIPLSLLAVIRIVGAWVAASDKPGLPFTEAEVAFLFPAPMTRRMLVHYKLLSGQFPILLSAVIFAVISNRGSAFGGNTFTHAVGWWIILSTLSLHSMGAAFTVTRLGELGIGSAARRTVVIVLVAIILGTAVSTALISAPRPTDAQLDNPLSFVVYLAGLTNHGALYWLALPLRLLMGPFLATGWMGFLGALGPALAILAGHYAWVLRAETSFEEGSIAFAEKRARVISAMQTGNFRALGGKPKAGREPFRLKSAGGRPEAAFLWKNMLSTHAWLSPRAWVVAAAVTAVVTALIPRGIPVAMLSSIFLVYVFLLGPQLARQDLRGDLANADLLKSYPLRGWQVALGEMLTPVGILTGIVWLGLIAIAVSAVRTGGDPSGGDVIGVALLVLAALVTPLVLAIQVIIPNAATILFPSWTPQARAREQGFDVLGQRLIFVAGQMMVILFALAPVAVFGAAVGFAASLILSPVISAILGAATIGALLAAEIVCGVLFIGHRFEQLDISAEATR